MTKEKAEAITREIQEICRKHALWLDVNRVFKPELRDIVLTVSVRITEK